MVGGCVLRVIILVILGVLGRVPGVHVKLRLVAGTTTFYGQGLVLGHWVILLIHVFILLDLVWFGVLDRALTTFDVPDVRSSRVDNW